MVASRRIRVSMALALLVLIATVLASQPASIAQDVATPAASPAVAVGAPDESLFVADGVTSSVLARFDAEQTGVVEPRFLLERIVLSPQSELPERATAAPELLFVESGAVQVLDNFGFGRTVEAGEQIDLNAGASYSLSNDGPADATVLRFSLAAVDEAVEGAVAVTAEPPAGLAGVTASPVATSVTAVAAPLPEIQTLIDQPLDQLPFGEVSLFIAEATFAPGAESGEYLHEGPLGIYVESGVLSVLSPSGVIGELPAESGGVLLATAPLVASNEGDADATVLLAGVVQSGESLVVEVTPEPTPSPVPTSTPVPTPTLVPTPTAEPTPTPAPTLPPTPVPTSTPRPTPTPVPTTAKGTILQEGQSWRTNDAALTVAAEGCGDGAMILTVTYENLSASRADFTIPPEALRVYDDQRQNWGIRTFFCGGIQGDGGLFGDRVILESGETRQYRLLYEAPGEGYTANVFVAVDNFGAVSGAKWGFTYDAGRILTLPPGAVDPTVGGAAEPGSQAVTASSSTGQPDEATSGAVGGNFGSPPIVSSSSAAVSLPEAYVGVWEGNGVQVDPNVEWPVTVILSGGSVGMIVGSTDYPTYGCGGNLILQSVTAESVTFTETLTYEQRDCADNGTIALSLAPDGSLGFAWVGISSTGANSSATATLYRT